MLTFFFRQRRTCVLYMYSEDRGALGRSCLNLFCNPVEPVSQCFYKKKHYRKSY